MGLNHSCPRDLLGYGPEPPDPQWPIQAKVAVQFVLNYEEGGENCVLYGDPQSESYLWEIVGAPGLAGVRNMNIESVSYTHLRAHETGRNLVCRLLL